MRLQRALARAGVASRRRAEDMIRAGRVKVNGRVAEIGASVDPDTDLITVGGRRIAQSQSVWIALNKPLGYVVTKRDPQGRRTVFELLPRVPGLTYVGRLDVATSGLLLLTTDGTAAHRMVHPRFGVERTYRVLVHGRSANEIRRMLARPVVIDGRPVQLVKVIVRESERGSTDLTLVLAEGRYRIVRRLCERLGLKVERLTRLSHGPVRLGRLAPGEWRYLSKRELQAVRDLRAA
ncbi:MAG: pseudouridine synthase [Gemmatimonadales bacterium]